MGHLSRKPTPNEAQPQPPEGAWDDDNEFYDAVCLLLNGLAVRCAACRGVVLRKNIVAVDGKDYCPWHAPGKEDPTRRPCGLSPVREGDYDAGEYE